MSEWNNDLLIVFQIANLVLLFAIITLICVVVRKLGRYMRVDSPQFALTVGKNIKNKCLESGITEGDIAMKLRTTVRTVKRIEKGGVEISFREVYILSNLFNCPISDFLKNNDYEENDKK